MKESYAERLATASGPESYYEHRERFNQLLSEGQGETEEGAALFYYLNRTGYNGLCRFNSKGEFNVPFGRHLTINYRSDFRGYQGVFSQFVLANLDFAELTIRPSDFVYADPPYNVQFTSCSKHGFTWKRERRSMVSAPSGTGCTFK